MSGLTSIDSYEIDRLTNENIHTGSKYLLENVATVPELQIDINPVSPKQLKHMFPKIEEVSILELNESPQILIGLDHAELIATQQIIITTKNGPRLQETKLGMTITGRVFSTEGSGSEYVHFLNKLSNVYRHKGDASAIFDAENDHSATCSTVVGDDFSAIWRTDEFGCKYAFSKPHSPDGRKADRILQEGVKHDGVRWVAPLLRRDEHEEFPASRTMAEKRAISLEKRLDGWTPPMVFRQ